MGGDKIEIDILDFINQVSTATDIMNIANHIADYIEGISSSNSFTPQEMMALTFLVKGTIDNQIAVMMEEYIISFRAGHDNDEESISIQESQQGKRDIGLFDLGRDHNTFPYGTNHGPDPDYPDRLRHQGDD